jgi:hypothetical protein
MSGYTPNDGLEPMTDMERDALRVYAVQVLENILAELRYQHGERKRMIDELARSRQEREADP